MTGILLLLIHVAANALALAAILAGLGAVCTGSGVLLIICAVCFVLFLSLVKLFNKLSQ